MSKPAPSFIVTTLDGGNTHSRVWESDNPLPLGFPLRGSIERSPRGLRVRDLSAPPDQIVSGRLHEIPFENLDQGPCEVDVRGHRFRIQRARPLQAVSDQAPTGGELRIHRCLGAWVLESFPLRKRFAARIRGRPVFELNEEGTEPDRRGGSWRLTSRAAGLKLSLAGEPVRALGVGETVVLPRQELVRSLVSWLAAETSGIQSWRFGLAEAPAFSDGVREGDPLLRREEERFQQAIRAALITLGALIALSWIWPKPRDDSRELIPPQFARIVMTRLPKPLHKTAAGSDTGAPSSLPPTKARDTAIARAFRARALNQAVSGLLKGGMSRLLAQSDFVTGAARPIEARSLFSHSRPPDLLGSGLAGEARITPRTARVAVLGGGGSGPGGLGVGYGRGQRAGVKGQGKGFVPVVAADADGSAVDEGLTRDEVGEVIHRHLSEVRYCYESAMIRMPDLEGKLVTAFTINGGGIVRDADVKSSTLPDPRLDDCILRRLVTWRFPKPRGGVDVAVSYPFIFKTLGR